MRHINSIKNAIVSYIVSKISRLKAKRTTGKILSAVLLTVSVLILIFQPLVWLSTGQPVYLANIIIAFVLFDIAG